MKFVTTALTGLMLITWPAYALAEYKDSPMNLTPKGQAFIDTYSKQAVTNLPIFDARLKDKDEHVIYYIMSEFYEGEAFEVMYVRVTEKKADTYIGTLASTPVQLENMTFGETCVIPRDRVRDWCIVDAEGEETGNLTGKAIDALQAGGISFILSMKPEGNTFAEFKVESALNPRTKQNVIEIVPPEIITKVEEEAYKRFGKLRAESSEVRYNYINVGFPGWKIFE